MLVHEDRARDRGQSLDKNFGTFFAGFMVFSFVGAVLAMILWPPQAASEIPNRHEPYTAELAGYDALVENFERLVFDDGTMGRSLAWDHSPNASLYGKGSEDLRPWVQEQFEIVNQATGMTVTLKESVVGPEDIYIQLITRAAYTADGDWLCYNQTAFKGVGQRIRKDYIIIPDDHPSDIARGCVVHELMHALGFKEHPTVGFDSVLSTDRHIGEFTVNDLILLRTLYDPAINPSMTRDQIMAIVPEIIRKAQFEIANSVTFADGPWK
ncbi:MAG: DUF2927 domain-containing protein [Alphaproteobacteria bacterium]|jgi:hypothetical protein|nr:DUF2927 domain-containing protein [Alphaproteobacteria bacterium]